MQSTNIVLLIKLFYNNFLNFTKYHNNKKMYNKYSYYIEN